MELPRFSLRMPQKKVYLALVPLLAVALALLACSINLASSGDSSLQQTQTAVSSQAAALAEKSSSLSLTLTAQQAALGTQAALAQQPAADYPATSAALAAQLTATAQALAVGQAPLPVMQETPLPPELPTSPPPPPPSGEDFNAWKSNASVLVYEDMVADPSEALYVKDTLKNMGIRNTAWDGNAMGRFKTDLLGGSNGKPWDLVIIAGEDRDDVSGEYFEYLSDALGQGSAVILESYYLDAVSEGKVSPILIKCGVEVYPYVTKTGTTLDGVMYPLPGGMSHPVMTTPNSGMAFTRARDTWLWTFDLGSKMALTGQGDAQLLIGTSPNEDGQDGTLAVCMGGQLTLQTFSSHTFSYQIMYPLWENTITNALQYRFQNQGQ